MQCRQCGTEIAEKALICYRCGTAVSEPIKPPAQARSTRRVALTVILMAGGALAAVFTGLCATGWTPGG
jgi:uncharacterized membrane protein YvbJ